MNRKWLTMLAPLAIAGAMVVAPALAAPTPVQVVPGAVVTVAGTPHLWIADTQGVIHFASDPSALAGRPVNWSTQFVVRADQVATMPIGEPWLSSAFVKIGNEIYLPQWDTGTYAYGPTLRHIQSTEDLALLGVDADNYGDVVLDQATWEQLYGMSLGSAEFAGDFVMTPPAPPAPEVSTAEETPAPSSSEESSVS